MMGYLITDGHDANGQPEVRQLTDDRELSLALLQIARNYLRFAQGHAQINDITLPEEYKESIDLLAAYGDSPVSDVLIDEYGWDKWDLRTSWYYSDTIPTHLEHLEVHTHQSE